jgi:hypothetical protein
VPQVFAVGHEQLFVRPHANGGAVHEHQQRVPQVVLLDPFPAEEILRIHRLRLPVVGEDDAFILAVILGRVLLVLGLLAKQIGADGAFPAKSAISSL